MMGKVMKKLTIAGAILALSSVGSVARAAPSPYSCTWIEKAGTVLSSVPKDCIDKRKPFNNFDSETALSERLDAVIFRRCIRYSEAVAGKAFANVAALSDGKDTFTVDQYCRQ